MLWSSPKMKPMIVWRANPWCWIEAEGAKVFKVTRQEIDLSAARKLNSNQALVGLLSAAQTKVFHLLVQGKRNKEIAHLLNVAERTVKFHVGGILKVLGCESRGEVCFKFGSES
jgi:DNA-binding NarL/FixJ family response regulator